MPDGLNYSSSLNISTGLSEVPAVSIPNNAMVDEVGNMWVDETGNVMVST